LDGCLANVTAAAASLQTLLHNFRPAHSPNFQIVNFKRGVVTATVTAATIAAITTHEIAAQQGTLFKRQIVPPGPTIVKGFRQEKPRSIHGPAEADSMRLLIVAA
jgi:hypothetical protein